MAKRKLNRIKQIEQIVDAIDFKDKGFKQAIRYESKQQEVSFNRLRHYTNAEGVEVYVDTWNQYRDKLRDEGISSKMLIQSYHHVYQNQFNEAIFKHVVTYLKNK